MKLAETQKKRWLYLAVCSLGLLFVGVIYAWSILKAPLAQEFGWTASQLAVNYTVMMCFFCLGALTSGFLTKKWAFRKLLVLSAALILLGYSLLALLPGGSLGRLYVLYGVVVGFGIGISYNSLLATGNAWFPDRKGTSSGLMMMCFGFSTMLLGKLAAKLFDLPAFGWRKTFLLLGVSIAIVLVLCMLIVRRPAAGDELPAPKKKAGSEDVQPLNSAARETIRRPTFWLFYVYGFLAASVGSTVISFAKDLSMSLGAAAETATLLVGILSICNGFGRILCGVSFDTLGRRKTMILASGITVIAPAIMLAAILSSSLPLAVLSFCLTGVSYGTVPTVSAAFIGAFYGTKDYALNYSISNTKLLFSSFTATAAAALLGSTGTYFAPFVLLFAMAALAFVLVFAIRRP